MSNATEPRVWLHVGLGSFHRAHQALYLHMLRETGDTQWSLAGGNVRPDMAETIAALVEQKGSAPIYPLLKRADEKYVTEEAYDHPKFVEDILRDVVLALRDLPGVAHFSVACENFESIHNHNAYAGHEETVSP